MTVNLFGTSGIRGDADRLFTNQFCFDIGRTFAIFLNKFEQLGAIAIGMDPRGSSPRIQENIINGLVYENRQVYNEGATPVPSMNYIVNISEHICASIMISGSHIQPHLNGIKFFAFEEEILKRHEEEINKIYETVRGTIKINKAKDFEIYNEARANEEYQEYLIKNSNKPYHKWKVVVDPGDGAQSDTMPQVLNRLGLKVVEINSTIQGEFYSRDTEVFEDFLNLQKKVLSEKADFGIGYDSDGDRCIFIDEKGNFIPGDNTCTLLVRESKEKAVVTTISTSQVIDKIGKKVFRTKIGSPYVVEMMKSKNISFGFEPNGGAIFSDMYSRDGGRTTIEILNLLKKSGKSLSELVTELPKYYIYKSKVEYKWEQKEEIIKEAELNFKGIKVDKTDGLKIWINDTTWILFRSSMNAPEFRIFTESDKKADSIELFNKGIKLVKSIVNSNE